MARKAATSAPAAPAANATGSDVHRMAWEVSDTPAKSAEESLFEILGSDEEQPEETDGPVSEAVEVEDEPVEEEPDDTDGEPEADEWDDEGDEPETEDADEVDEEPADEPQAFKVSVDGEEVEVTLDELLKGYSRTSDYTRKTQALAEQRKAIEAEATQYREQRDAYATLLPQLQGVLEQVVPAEPDWDTLRKELDPGEFAARFADHQRATQQLNAVRTEQERIQREQAEEAQRNLAETLAAEQARLLEAIPEWQDTSKASADKKALVDYAAGLGYTEQDLANVNDHRLILMLRDAMRYRELTTKGAEAVAEKKVAAKVLKPGPRVEQPRKAQNEAVRRARKQLAQTGRPRDAANLIEQLLSDDD